MTASEIKLRPYHPPFVVCCFSGESVGAEDRNMAGFESVYDILKNDPNIVIELVKEFDDICKQCKKLEDDDRGSIWGVSKSCDSSRNGKVVEDVHRCNRKILDILGLDYGSKIKWSELVNLLAEKLPVLNDPVIGSPKYQGKYEKGLKFLLKKEDY